MLSLLDFIKGNPALAEFIERPVGKALDDKRRKELVQKRIVILRPYVSNPDIHQSMRADFSEALSLTESMPPLLSSLLSIQQSLEGDRFNDQWAMLLAGEVMRRRYERTGMLNLWEALGPKVLATLHQAAGSSENWNAADLLSQAYPDISPFERVNTLLLASSIMVTFKSICGVRDLRITAMKFAPIYDALFYGGVLNGIAGRYQKTVIIDRLKHAAVSLVDDYTGVGLIREFADLLTDLLNFEKIISRQVDDLATVSKYLRSYLEGLRIVAALAMKLSEINSSFSDSVIQILQVDLPDVPSTE